FNRCASRIRAGTGSAAQGACGGGAGSDVREDGRWGQKILRGDGAGLGTGGGNLEDCLRAETRCDEIETADGEKRSISCVGGCKSGDSGGRAPGDRRSQARADCLWGELVLRLPRTGRSVSQPGDFADVGEIV